MSLQPATEAAYDATAFDSKPTMVEQTAYELTEDATEPQVMVNFISPASLLYVDGGDHLPSEARYRRRTRSAHRAQASLLRRHHRRPTRPGLHASIVEKEDGKFYIKDEGSSGGTYVNRRKLRVNDMVELHHNDIVNFNTVSYRFELNDQSEQARAKAQRMRPRPETGLCSSMSDRGHDPLHATRSIFPNQEAGSSPYDGIDTQSRPVSLSSLTPTRRNAHVHALAGK